MGNILNILGQVAAQGDDAIDARCLIAIEQGFEGGGGVTDAGKVRDGGNTSFVVELQDELMGAIAGCPPSPVGNREETGLVGSKEGMLYRELLQTICRFWREELEAQGKIFNHGFREQNSKFPRMGGFGGPVQ